MAIVRLDPLVCEKKYFLQRPVNLQWLYWGGGGERDLVLQSVGVLACAGYVEYLLLAR
jgi:hypothetical protein